MFNSTHLVRFVWTLAALSVTTAAGRDYVVARDGSGKFATIQDCAAFVTAGDTCVVYSGVYPERVTTISGGASDDSRVRFRAHGPVTVQGFEIGHQYVTIDGFDLTGPASAYQAYVLVTPAGNRCQILNNTIHDGPKAVSGIRFGTKGGAAASNCVVRGNRLARLGYPMLSVSGSDHLFDSNYLEYNESQDYIRLFGSRNTFRHNVFWRGTTVAGAGNHPDFVQTFGAADSRSEDHLFEENWIADLAGAQLGQLNSGDGIVGKGVLHGGVRNIIFRRNVIANIPANGNIGMPGVRFENNTFFRMASSASGLGFGGSLTRGDGSAAVVVNNAFINCGSGRAGSGYYWVSGSVYSAEVVGVLVTREGVRGGPIAKGIAADLQKHGYVTSHGVILGATTNITKPAQMLLSPAYSEYAPAVYETLMQTVRLNAFTRDTFYADYNYVYPAKPAGSCEAGRFYANRKWCEEHGINGLEGRFANLLDLLGPDGIPFTLDDGLKPAASSPLCGKGFGGTDIGAYSCNPNKVFADSPRTELPGRRIVVQP